MNKIIVSILTACALTFSVAAQDTNKSLFNANELSVSISSGYSVDNGFSDAYTFNFSVGAQYFLTKNLGVEANLPFYNEGVSLREVSAGLVGRVSLLHNVGLYAGGGAVYDWETTDNSWDYYAKAGLEVRLNAKWGLFGEYQYRVNDFENDAWKHGNQRVVAGIRLVF